MTCHSKAILTVTPPPPKSLNMMSIFCGLLWFFLLLYVVALPLPLSWAGIHMHVHREWAQGGCTALSVSLGWSGLPWINCYGAYWSKLMQAFKYKKGAQCRKCTLLQCATPITFRALAFRVISFHSKPTSQCTVSTGRRCLASVVLGETCQEGEMTSGCLF